MNRRDREKAAASKAWLQAHHPAPDLWAADRKEAAMTNRSWTEKLKLYGIPERMHPGIVRYVEEGFGPGGFLLAVFENDLVEAAARADDENAQLLGAYGKLLSQQFPPDSYGSRAKIAAWVRRGGIKGNDKNEPLPKQKWSRWAV